MKKIWLTLSILCSTTLLFAQAQHDAFKQDKELQTALINYDLRAFVTEPVTFVCDTIERQVNAAQLSELMKKYIPSSKKIVIRKASEANNGYVQSFGLYKDEDALYYVRFTLNPLTSKLEEVVVEKN